MPGGIKFGLKTKKKQYGLIKPSQFNAFGAGAEEEEDDIKTQLTAARKRREKKTQKEIDNVLKVDSTAYLYDEVYDELKTPAAEKELAHQRDKKIRKPKYIKQLLKQAKEREMEQNIIHDRMKVKEIEQEKTTYGETEKFVTGAYKRELAKREKWLQERDARDAKNKDVTKEGDFRLKLMQSVMGERNVAMGGGINDDDDDDDDDDDGEPSLPSSRSGSDATNIYSISGESNNVDDIYSDDNGFKKSNSSSGIQKEELISSTTIDNDLYSSDKRNTTDEVIQKNATLSNEILHKDVGRGTKRRSDAQLKESVSDSDDELDPLLEMQERKKKIKETISTRRNDETSIAAARTRYLERKKQRKQQGK